MSARNEYEILLKQTGRVIWLYGLSGSGKSTLTEALRQELLRRGTYAVILDGDAIRGTLNSDLGFSPEDRHENLRRTAELARFLAQRGIIVLTSFITPFRSSREMIHQILHDVSHTIGFLNANLKTCKQRDPKGIYRAHAEGRLKSLTGVDASFEIGPHDFEVNTDTQTAAESLKDLIQTLKF